MLNWGLNVRYWLEQMLKIEFRFIVAAAFSVSNALALEESRARR